MERSVNVAASFSPQLYQDCLERMKRRDIYSLHSDFRKTCVCLLPLCDTYICCCIRASVIWHCNERRKCALWRWIFWGVVLVWEVCVCVCAWDWKGQWKLWGCRNGWRVQSLGACVGKSVYVWLRKWNSEVVGTDEECVNWINFLRYWCRRCECFFECQYTL